MTRSFYLAESAEQAEALKNNPKEFFRLGQERIDKEIDRSKAILPVTAWALVREITEKAFWADRMEWLSEKSIVYAYFISGKLLITSMTVALADFMADKDFAALATMYTLFARVAGIKPLCDAFRNHVRVSTLSFITTDRSFISLIR
jgi:cullin-4